MLEELFMAKGLVNDVLVDNASMFRSDNFRSFLSRLKVSTWDRAAYRASGNSIVQRSYRTVKVVAKRAGISLNIAFFLLFHPLCWFT